MEFNLRLYTVLRNEIKCVWSFLLCFFNKTTLSELWSNYGHYLKITIWKEVEVVVACFDVARL
jgi:hypothetical protein